jgi:hypothetical protein
VRQVFSLRVLAAQLEQSLYAFPLHIHWDSFFVG